MRYISVAVSCLRPIRFCPLLILVCTEHCDNSLFQFWHVALGDFPDRLQINAEVIVHENVSKRADKLNRLSQRYGLTQNAVAEMSIESFLGDHLDSLP